MLADQADVGCLRGSGHGDDAEVGFIHADPHGVQMARAGVGERSAAGNLEKVGGVGRRDQAIARRVVGAGAEVRGHRLGRVVLLGDDRAALGDELEEQIERRAEPFAHRLDRHDLALLDVDWYKVAVKEGEVVTIEANVYQSTSPFFSIRPAISQGTETFWAEVCTSLSP